MRIRESIFVKNGFSQKKGTQKYNERTSENHQDPENACALNKPKRVNAFREHGQLSEL